MFYDFYLDSWVTMRLADGAQPDDPEVRKQVIAKFIQRLQDGDVDLNWEEFDGVDEDDE